MQAIFSFINNNGLGAVDYGPQSVVIDEAENRLHVQKAVLEILL